MGNDRLATILKECLLADVQVNKPGNVSQASAGHGMDAGDFIRSADATVPVLCDRRHAPGRRMQLAVEVTKRELGCNTNLGLILLCTPLVAAAEKGYGGDLLRLRHCLARVLRKLRDADGRCVLEAVRLAAPGGLGSSSRFDVRSYAGTDVRAAMTHACARDRIAWQYCSIFHDVFIVFLPQMADRVRRSADMEKAFLTCYIEILSRYRDSHIERQHGRAVALQVRDEAKTIRHNYFNERPERQDMRLTQYLEQFDRRLKNAGINPGTSADLSVATLFLWRLSQA